MWNLASSRVGPFRNFARDTPALTLFVRILQKVNEFSSKKLLQGILEIVAKYEKRRFPISLKFYKRYFQLSNVNVT